MSPPRRSSVRRRWRLFRYPLLALLVLFTAVGLGLGYADRLRPPLMAALSAALGQEVTSDRLRLGVAGLAPRLTLEQVVLQSRIDPGQQIRVPRLHLDVDLPASLTSREPRLKALVIEGLRLHMERDADGQLVVSGFPVGGEVTVGPVLGHVLDQGQLLVTAGEVEWLDRSSGTPLHLLSGVRLALDNQGGAHHLELQAALADGGRGGMLHLSADLRGESVRLPDWSGPVEFFLQANDLGWVALGGQSPAFQVAGAALDIKGHLGIEDARFKDLQAQLSVQALSVAGQVPTQGPLGLEAARLELQVEADARAGRLQVAGTDLSLRLPEVFGERPPIRVDHLAGPLDWTFDAMTGLRLSTSGLSAANPDLGVRLEFWSQVPWRTPGGDSPVLSDLVPAEAELDLRGEILNASALHIRDYLPDPKLRPRARAWLDRAFPAGRVPWGLILFQGRLADFPFRQEPGDFHVLLQVEDMALDFDPDWPRLEGLEGIVHFHNQGLAIATLGGHIRGVPLIEAQAAIPDLAETRFLEVRGTAQGPFSEALAFLGGTPLQTVLGALPRLFTAEGLARIDLDMDLPLDREDHPEDRLRLDGALSWPAPANLGTVQPAAARLRVAGTNLALDDLEGAVSFNADGVTRSRVLARFLSRPLTLDLERIRDGQSPEGLTGLRMAGKSAVKDLAGRLPAELWRYLEGEVPWELAVRIPDPPPQTEASTLAADFLLTSSLRGLEIKLPAPLGKVREAVRPLRLAWGVAPRQDLRVQGHYDDLALNLLFAADGRGGRQLRRGSLTAGQEQTELPPSEGLRIAGYLPQLDLTRWLDWAAGLPVTATSGSPPLSLAGLRIDRLHLGDLSLREVVLDLEQGPKTWDVQVESRELAGQLRIPYQPRSQPLQADFARLDLQHLLAGGSMAAEDKPGLRHKGLGPADPRRAWGLDLAVERLLWLDTELGRFSLRAEPTAEGLAIAEVRLTKPGQIYLKGNGAWVSGEGGDTGVQTVLDLAASTEDLGDLLQHLGYASPLADAPADVVATLAWPGGPGDLSPATLEGEIVLAIGKGSLLDVDPGVGRVLGVLNLGALGRRLSLDFTDLYDRGFVFQDITGKLGLQAGRVELIEPLLIEGTSAEVRIEGRANLLDQTLDQVATVTPSLGGGVALASAIAAGPLVGAAVLIADKASGGALDAIGRHAYDIRGPWANPEILPRASRATDAERASSGTVSPGAIPAASPSARDHGSAPTLTAESTLKSDPQSNPQTNSVSTAMPPVSPLKGNAFLDQP